MHRGIRAYNLSKAFADVLAVDDLSIEVHPGRVVGLIGPNGAGKTTTLRMLATLIAPLGGHGTVGGHDLLEAPRRVRSQVGYLTGSTGLYARLTPLELLEYMGRLHSMPRDRLRSRIEALVAQLHMAPFMSQQCGTLSTGQSQRVSIARAVLHDPQVLILDEPTSGLDILAAREALAFFADEAARGKAVLLSTHHMAEVEMICHEAVVIHHGRQVGGGTIETLRAQGTSLSKVFLDLLDAAGSRSEGG